MAAPGKYLTRRALVLTPSRPVPSGSGAGGAGLAQLAQLNAAEGQGEGLALGVIAWGGFRNPSGKVSKWEEVREPDFLSALGQGIFERLGRPANWPRPGKCWYSRLFARIGRGYFRNRLE